MVSYMRDIWHVTRLMRALLLEILIDVSYFLDTVRSFLNTSYAPQRRRSTSHKSTISLVLAYHTAQNLIINSHSSVIGQTHTPQHNSGQHTVSLRSFIQAY